MFRLQDTSRALSNRLKELLGSIVHTDQSYCVLDRTIMDNIFLIRDVVDVCKYYSVNTGIVSLDQQKAFDKVITPICFLHSRLLVLVMGLCLGLVYRITMHSVW